MMARWLTLLMVLFLAVAQAGAQESVVSDLSEDRIDISTNFTGSQILIYGAVKRMAPPPQSGLLDVIITVQGPSAPISVRRKARVFGLWIEKDVVNVDRAPSYYALTTTRPFNEIISDTEDLRYSISVPRAIRSVGAPKTIMDSPAFTEALIRLRTGRGLYQMGEGQVRLTDNTLFRAKFDIPSSLVEGAYRSRIFLLRNKKVIALDERTIYVRKVGLERWLRRTAYDQPALYGFLSLVIAVGAGWAASAGFRVIRH